MRAKNFPQEEAVLAGRASEVRSVIGDPKERTKVNRENRLALKCGDVSALARMGNAIPVKHCIDVVDGESNT